MILVTVGTQLPFDRLIRMVDEIAPLLHEVTIAQVGKTSYRPANIEWKEALHPTEFDRLLAQARVIVSHAGIGSVLTAGRLGKPIILFPRLSAFKEHRNDHQLATARQLKDRPGIYVAQTRQDLIAHLTSDLAAAGAGTAPPAGRQALITYLRGVIQQTRP